MPKLFVDRTIEITAPASVVWDILTKPGYTARWADAFSQGEFAHLESDWKKGSAVHWLDAQRELCVDGNVTVSEPGKLLRFTVFDARSELGERALVTEEDGITFALSEEEGVTMLHLLQGDFGVMDKGEMYRDLTDKSWDLALPVIQMLAEREIPMSKYEGAREWVQKLEDEGYSNVMVCDFGGPNMEFGEHTHDEATVHVMLKGDLTLIEKGAEETLHKGDRFEIPAGTTHNAKCGPEGCVFVVGEKKNVTYSTQFLGSVVTVRMEIPMGGRHPEKTHIFYQQNYGFIPGIPAPDGDDLDAYVLGVFEPLEEFTGRCIAVIHRTNEDDDKLVVVPEGREYTDDQIRALTEFVEQYHQSVIIR